MDTIKNILIDGLNGFSLKYIPLFLTQLLTAGFLGYVLQKVMNKKFKEEFTVLASAAILLLVLKNKERSNNESIGLFLVAIIGVGCGVGSIVQTFLAVILLLLVILFLPLKKDA
jgi:hypothetical protein